MPPRTTFIWWRHSLSLYAAAASPPYWSRFLQMFHAARSASRGWTVPGTWYLHQQVQAQAFSAGGTDGQMSCWTHPMGEVFSEEAIFDMQIKLPLAPSSLTQFCFSSQHGFTLTSASSTSAHSSFLQAPVFCFVLFCSKAHASLCAMVISHPLLVLGRLCFSSCRREL